MLKRKFTVFVIALLLCASAALGGLLHAQRRETERLRLREQARYQHAFTELCTGLSGVDTALQKSLYARGAAMESACCAEIFEKAAAAQMALGLMEFKGRPIPSKARALLSSFREKAGATQCRVLKGIDTGEVLCPCDDCVRYAIDALEEALS